MSLASAVISTDGAAVFLLPKSCTIALGTASGMPFWKLRFRLESKFGSQSKNSDSVPVIFTPRRSSADLNVRADLGEMESSKGRYE